MSIFFNELIISSKSPNNKNTKIKVDIHKNKENRILRSKVFSLNCMLFYETNVFYTEFMLKYLTKLTTN